MLNLIPKKRIAFLIADIILIAFSVLASFLVRFELAIPSIYFQNIEGIIILTVLITIPIFYFLKLYSFSWVYVSAGELISLIKGTGLSFLILAASFFILKDHSIFSGFPRSTLFINYFFIFLFCGGIRFAKRIYLQVFSGQKFELKERTLIVGAGDAGEGVLRSIMSSKFSPYSSVGFVDDNPEKQGIIIHGLKVLGTIDDIPAITARERVEGLIVALPSAGSSVIKTAVEKGRAAGLKKIRIVPSFEEVISGTFSLGTLREVGMEDLLKMDFLGKEPIIFDQSAIAAFVQNKKILVTGAAGSIGSELCRQIAKFKPGLLLILDQDETGIFNIYEEISDNFSGVRTESLICDILDREKLEKIFKKFSPQLVFHAAAYKHVPLMENDPGEAVRNNIFGTKHLVEVAREYGTEKFVFISTDKAVKPASVMGATKRIGEMICQNLNNGTQFISVRFGNVLNSRGSVIHIFREQIKRGGPVEVTHRDMERYFMATSEACLLVMQAAAMGQGGEIFVLDMGKPYKILDLAETMIRLSGFEPHKDIPIRFTGPRPGEKLSEEILTAEEETIATKNQKIFIVKLPSIEKEKLSLGLERLKKGLNAFSNKEIKETLKEIVSNYHFTPLEKS